MSMPDTEVSQLLQRIRGGSDSALGPLLNGYRDYLLRIATDRLDSALRPKLAPSDIVQGSLLVATEQFPTFRGDSEQQFRSWLLRILTSQLVDGVRRFAEAEKRRTDREVPRGHSVVKKTTTSSESPSQLASLHEESAWLLSTIHSLPRQQREIVHARYLEGLTFRQISEKLQLPLTTCRRLWVQAANTIARSMGADS